MLLAVPVALAAAVAVGLSGQPFIAACFVGLACLLIARANILDNGLMAGAVVVVYLAQPAGADPGVAALGLMAGAVVAIVVLARIPRTGRRSPIAPEIAYLHAGTMAGAVAVDTFLVVTIDVPHGSWIPMTMTMALRPVGSESQTIAYQRIAGTALGALVAIALLELPPAMAARERDELSVSPEEDVGGDRAVAREPARPHAVRDPHRGEQPRRRDRACRDHPDQRRGRDGDRGGARARRGARRLGRPGRADGELRRRGS